MRNDRLSPGLLVPVKGILDSIDLCDRLRSKRKTQHRIFRSKDHHVRYRSSHLCLLRTPSTAQSLMFACSGSSWPLRSERHIGGATHPSVEGWNRSGFTRVSQSRSQVSPPQPAHRQRAKQDLAGWRDALATSAGPSMTGKRSDRRNAVLAPNRAAGLSGSARCQANS